MKVRFGQSGYLGARMSVRAARARREGKLPATEAAREWGFKSPAALRSVVRPCEWHHTGKFARATDFFDVAEAVHQWKTPAEVPAGLFRALTAKGREIFSEILRENFRQNWLPAAAPADHVVADRAAVRAAAEALKKALQKRGHSWAAVDRLDWGYQVEDTARDLRSGALSFQAALDRLEKMLKKYAPAT